MAQRLLTNMVAEREEQLEILFASGDEVLQLLGSITRWLTESTLEWPLQFSANRAVFVQFGKVIDPREFLLIDTQSKIDSEADCMSTYRLFLGKDGRWYSTHSIMDMASDGTDNNPRPLTGGHERGVCDQFTVQELLDKQRELAEFFGIDPTLLPAA